MDDSTKREFVEQGASVAGALIKQMVTHRNQVEVMERKKDKEIELAEVKQKHQPEPTGDDGQQSQPTPQNHQEAAQDVQESIESATPKEIESAIDKLIDEEMCSVCRDLLIELKKRTAEKQVRGLMEYGEFKGNLSSGADADELKQTLRETDVLYAIFQEKYTAQEKQA